MPELAQKREVLILGAGFSHAVGQHLPLANALGRMAYEEASRRAPSLFEDLYRDSQQYPFEVWLSLLAEDQPHLDEGENKLNAARFAKLSEAIVEVLDDCESLAIAERPEPWFFELLSVLHERRGTVISLNYDTLLEVGVKSMHLRVDDAMLYFQLTSSGQPGDGYVPSQPPRVWPHDLLRGQPMPARPSSKEHDRPSVPTMRLLKLHGSLDWWWVPEDQSGATLLREELVSTFGDPHLMTPEQRGINLPGRAPFIVPPLASKSPYYRNPLTRQLWQDAYEALCGAERIVLIGYSLPETDIVMAGMLASAIQTSGAKVRVVDLDPEPVESRLRAIGAAVVEPQVPPSPGRNRIDSYVFDLCRRHSAEIATEIGQLKPLERDTSPDPAVVQWSRQGSPSDHLVTELEWASEESLTIRYAAEAGFNRRVGTPDGCPTTGDVVRAVAAATRISTVAPDGREVPFVGFSAQHFHDPNARHVLYLIPAGQLP